MERFAMEVIPHFHDSAVEFESR